MFIFSPLASAKTTVLVGAQAAVRDGAQATVLHGIVSIDTGPELGTLVIFLFFH